MCSTKTRILQSDNNPLRKLKAATTTRLWVALTIGFASWSPAVAADGPTGKPQIQGGNLRIEFDNHLRSRVVARFDKTKTLMGPFTASETVTTADKPWTGFLLTSQKHGRTKDAFGEGERLIVEGKAIIAGVHALIILLLKIGVQRYDPRVTSESRVLKFATSAPPNIG